MSHHRRLNYAPVGQEEQIALRPRWCALHGVANIRGPCCSALQAWIAPHAIRPALAEINLEIVLGFEHSLSLAEEQDGAAS
jgi:hypothetical protein